MRGSDRAVSNRTARGKEAVNFQQAEPWATDGHRVWRAPSGPTVCMLGDPTQPSLFDDAETTAMHYRDAAMIVCAPRLVAALAECADRLERCCHHSGSAAEFAMLAVKEYRQLVREARSMRSKQREET
jgi:hypothetical protein